MKARRLAYLVSHPIQYHAPLLRRIASDPEIELHVFFCSDMSTGEYFDPEFGEKVEWGIPLLDGYSHEFLPALGRTGQVSWLRPFNYGLRERLRKGNFDALWVHGYARWFNLFSMLMARQLGIKVLLRDDSTLISRKRGVVKRLLKKGFFSFLNSLCDAFLAVGTLNREYFKAHGIPEDKVFLLPQAVDNLFFQQRAREAAETREDLRSSLGLEQGRPIILFVGKMIPQKRAQDLLEAYARLSVDGKREPLAYLLFVGDGENRAQLEKRAGELGWGSIKFLGFKNQSELPRYYDLCDVFVLPSVHETWGFVVNEVMNAGRAIVLSDNVGCTRDLLIDRLNGCCFKTGDIQELENALRRILEDPQRLKEMGEHSLRTINSWSQEEFVQGLKEALSRVLLTKG